MDKTHSPVSFPDERMDTSTASEEFKSNNRRYKTRLKAYNEQSILPGTILEKGALDKYLVERGNGNAEHPFW